MPTPSCSHLTSRPLTHRWLSRQGQRRFSHSPGMACSRAPLLHACIGLTFARVSVAGGAREPMGSKRCFLPRSAARSALAAQVQQLVSSPGVTLLQSLLGQRASFFFSPPACQLSNSLTSSLFFCLSVHYLICQIPSHPFSSYR